MPNHIISGSKVYFRQSNLPVLFFILLGQLGIYIELTGNHRYPYAIEISEADFYSCVEMAKEL